MKRISTLFFAAICVTNLAGQSHKFARPGSVHQPKPAFLGQSVTGLEDFSGGPVHSSIPPSQSGIRTTDEIGFTFYDLQANASDNSHLVNLGNGDLRAIWIFNKKAGDAGFADRGTAYAKTVSGVFPTDPSAQPKERIESVRTGFGTLGVLSDGSEVVVSHRSNGTGKFLLHYAKRPAGGGTWTEGDIPTTSPNGLLWARLAATGNTLHVIALTTPTATNTGGVLVNGINGEIRYFRSTDGGANWDKVDVLLPGLDSSVLRQHNAEQYVIDADGDNVAIGVFPTLSDICYWKSTDGGKLFTKHTIYKMPLKNFVPGDGYTIADIDTAFSSKPFDGLANDSLAVWSSDEHGSIRIDGSGKVHIAYGAGFVKADAANTTGAYSTYPSTGGIVYWNEDMPEDVDELDGYPVGELIATPLDYDGNGGIDIDVVNQYNGYGGAFMASKPTMGLGSGNTLYLAYLAADERYISSDLDEAFAHVHIKRSNDGGATWIGPYDVNNTDNMDEVEISFTETAFPFLARNCSDKIHLLFEQDNIPGSFVTDNASAAPTADDITYLKYLGLDPNSIVANKEIARPSEVAVKLFPNPASEVLNVEIAFLKKTENASISVFDLNGRLVFQQNQFDAASGRTVLPISQLQNGLYSLTVRTDFGLASRKFSVIR